MEFSRFSKNVVLATDSYKASQRRMFEDADFDEDGLKEKLVRMYAFIEARTGGKHPEIVVAGVQHVANLLSHIRVTKEMVDEAVEFYTAHFGSDKIFDRTPWDVVVDKYHGCLPLEFKALPEGTIVPLGTPICTIESTDEECAQLVSHFEGLIQKAVWYPTTVATMSLAFSKVIAAALDRTTTPEVKAGWLPFAHQDFGYRGAASEESAQLGGAAHLYISWGSDTVPACDFIMKTMGDGGKMPGFSVAASEHNQMMSKGREGEFKIVKRLIKTYPSGILSVVADTYDMINFVEQVTIGELREMIMARDGTFVIRPDSLVKFRETDESMSVGGTVRRIFQILGTNLADVVTTNAKGFKVLPKQYKVIYGDGLNVQKVQEILEGMELDGWSAENIVFGTGGNLLQKGIDRDTERFAMKASEQEYEIETRDGRKYREVRHTCKETPGKESKKGRFHVAEVAGKIVTVPEGTLEAPNMLKRLSCNGNVCCPLDNITQIRARVNEHRAKMGY
jgi:nicotinamide phosphoribosyltransferase